MPDPRDPLLNQTLAVPKDRQVSSSIPSAYRLAYYRSEKRYVQQGAFLTYNAQDMPVFEWRDIPTVFLP